MAVSERFSQTLHLNPVGGIQRHDWYELTTELAKYEEEADLRQHIWYEELYGEHEAGEEKEKKRKFVNPDPTPRDTIQ
jgi:hypothetical protein